MKKFFLLLTILRLTACGGGGGGNDSNNNGDGGGISEIPIRDRAISLLMLDVIGRFHLSFNVVILFNPNYDIPADNIQKCRLSRLDSSGDIVNTIEYTPEALLDIGEGFKRSNTTFYTSINGNIIEISKRYMALLSIRLNFILIPTNMQKYPIYMNVLLMTTTSIEDQKKIIY